MRARLPGVGVGEDEQEAKGVGLREGGWTEAGEVGSQPWPLGLPSPAP